MIKMSYYKRVIRFSLLFIALILAGLPSVGAATPIESIHPTHYYYDEQEVLSTETKNMIEQVNRELEAKTGAQIFVATINNLGGQSAFDYSVALFNKLKIGDLNKKNGLLILLAKDTVQGREKNYLEVRVGYGLEDVLNDGKVGRIIDQFMLPYFQNKKIDQGLREGFNALVSQVIEKYDVTLDGKYDQYQQKLKTSDEDIFSTAFIRRAIIVMVILWFILPKNGRGGRRRRRIFWPYIFGGGSFGGFGGGSFGGGSGGGFSGGGGSTGGGGAGRSF